MAITVTTMVEDPCKICFIKLSFYINLTTAKSVVKVADPGLFWVSYVKDSAFCSRERSLSWMLLLKERITLPNFDRQKGQSCELFLGAVKADLSSITYLKLKSTEVLFKYFNIYLIPEKKSYF